MKNALLQLANKLNKNQKRRKWWNRTVRALGTVVVFCTTYALILPAITMEQEAICGIEAHEHIEECYTQQPVMTLACSIDADARVIHTHDTLCYDAQGALVCPLTELQEHKHDESCYVASQTPNCAYVHVHNDSCQGVKSVLVCGREETESHVHSDSCTIQRVLICETAEHEGHTHGEGCASTEQILICTETDETVHVHDENCYELRQIPCEIPESAGHVHNEDCYEMQTVVCALEETEPHIHTEACYEEQEMSCELTTNDGHVHESQCYPQELSCDREEINLHTHEDACYDEAGGLICTQPQVIAHVHGEACMAETEQLKTVLTCELEEHIHEESCYPEEEEPPFAFICGMGVHAHVETCYDEAGELICTIPEHAHEAACIVEDLDLTADVETEADWQELFQGMSRTGNWPRDVLAVAESQLNYHESEKNVILAGEELKGYTRYGAWYGDPYGDWDTMFVSFCLNYAGVEGIPQGGSADAWMNVMKELQLYAAPDAYTPKAGDLIFFDYDQVEEPLEEIPVVTDQVGIVAEVTPATEAAPGSVSFIIGDYEDQVSYVTCDLEDVTIVGYTDMPAGDIFCLTYEGADFTVTVTVGKEAAIPDSAQLAVREIEEGTDEYNTYYQQSVEALMNGAAGGEKLPEVSFARFFDISFLVDGVAVEPAAPVDIQIRYQDMIEKKEEEDGLVVHFAEEGVEILDADTYSAEPVQEESVLDELTEFFTGASEKVDTFRFTQDSFSVSGTLVSTRAAITTATKVKPWEIDNTGNTMYVLYAQVGDRYYALDGNGLPVQITVDGHTLTLPGTNTSNLFWTFVDKPSNNENYKYNPVTNVGTKRYLHPFHNSSTDQGLTTSGPWDVQLILNNNSNEDLITFKILGNNRYAQLKWDETSQPVQSANDGTNFYVAQVGSGAGKSFNVWFDGTLGGMMSYYGAANENRPVTVGENGEAVVELPETWQSSTKYPYKLQGWYDINTHQYYAVNPDDNIQPTATITGNTVFYADWIAATYDVGQSNENVVNSVDTSDFITTHVFDYNVLFNVLSQSHTGRISAADHSENWTILNNGEAVPYNGENALGFSFVDYDSNGDISYANGRDNNNISRSVITPGILNKVNTTSGKDLLDLLFNPNTEVIGKYYAGTGNYLFQYMDSTMANYDGEHDGYYYLDARLNAASYNQSQQRFYLYDYLERTSDSAKDGGAGQYSDLLPFNSPYIFDADQVDTYTDSIRRPGYEYDAKDGANSYQDYNSVDDAATNYFFGIRSDIEFFLPNDTGWQDEYGNYGNISTRGEHMVFDFHGDDDVWVFIDGNLVLDIGGMHGIMHGSIDFSTGTVSYGADGSENNSSLKIGEGTHTMTVYYMERGSSQSNCAIYFNIAPRYDLEITKEDIVTANKLDGAVFSIFNDEAMTDPAELWNSFEEHESEAPSTNRFTVTNGVAKCWGISAGKTYYIYETTPPPGYPASDDMIRITLNNRGTATIETTTLHGSNGVATEGFAVIKQNVNDTLKIVALTVTNQKEGDTTEVRVEKTWDENSNNLPQYITVYLTADGERIGRSARLTESNGWSYTWTGLPKYRDEGIDQEIEYVVEEVFVPDYITVQGDSVKVENYVDWVRVDQMSDSKTFLLVHNNQAMTYDGSSFGWMSITEAEMDASQSAHWKVTTDHDGFHLKNELGYNLTYGASGFYGTESDDILLNQVFYYLNSRLMVHDHDVYYQFGSNGAVVLEDGLAFQLYQKEPLTGLLTNIVNKPVDEAMQTFVEVSKSWADGADKHAWDSVTIRLFADGKDTGRSLILDAGNNWQGSFDDLPYYQDGTETPIVYTVVEDKFGEYIPSYSDPQTREGRPVSFWQNVNTLTQGDEAYRIAVKGYSLTALSDGSVSGAINDLDSENQQWRVVKRDNDLILQNVATGRYLSTSNSTLSTTGNQSWAAAVSMSNGYVLVGGQYLELGINYAFLTTNASNVNPSDIRVTRWVTTNGMDGTGYTVTNSIGYVLPKTGGIGTSYFTFGGLLMIAAALMYVNKFGRKHRRGGKYSR